MLRLALPLLLAAPGVVKVNAIPFISAHERFLSIPQYHEMIGFKSQEEVGYLAFREIFWVINTNQHEEQAGMIEMAEKLWASNVWNKIYLTDYNIS